jgi:HupE / UreJ protein
MFVGKLVRPARLTVMAALALAAVLAPTAAQAHDVPSEILVRGFVKAEGDRLQVVARVPLILLSQLDLPKRGPGYLDLGRIDPALDHAAEKVASEFVRFSDDRGLLAPDSIEHRISLPSENEFDDYEEALQHARSQDLPAREDVFWNQGYFDVHLAFPITAGTTDLYIDPVPPPGVGDKLEVLVQYVSSGEAARTFRLPGDSDRVALDPTWLQAAGTFVESGVAHIIGGIDHLLFLLCLVLPIRNLRRLVPVVTSFTVAHSIALIASAQGLVPSGEWFPPVVEATIAASIVYMAVENVVAPNLHRRWIVTGIFGVVHGFGFSYGLQNEFQLAGDHLLTSLLSFNIGVEIGQLLVLAAVIPVLTVLFRVPALSRFGVAVASVVIGHTGWHWMMERASVFPSIEWPALGESIVALARWVVVGMVVFAAVRLLGRVHRRDRPATNTAEVLQTN